MQTLFLIASLKIITMYRKLLLIIVINGFLLVQGISQSAVDNKFRTIDGTFNNISNPSWGATGSNLVRLGKASYQDGIYQPYTSRISGRAVSNEIFAQDDIDILDPSNLSDFCWVFGQFIDHEFGLTPNNTERFDISVPPGDIWFDPNDSGNAVIQMKRNIFDKTTGLCMVTITSYTQLQKRDSQGIQLQKLVRQLHGRRVRRDVRLQRKLRHLSPKCQRTQRQLRRDSA